MLVRNIANSGLLVEVQGIRMLLDPFSSLEGGPYPLTAPEDLEAMRAGHPPFDRISLLFISHHHPDHFHPEAAAALLQSNPDISLITTPQAMEQVLARLPAGFPTQRFFPVYPGLYQKTVLPFPPLSLHVAGTLHMGRKLADVPHLSLLIEADRRVLFTGDAVASPENFSSLHQEGELDLLICPFPYITKPSSQALVAECLRPKRQIVVHLPSPQGKGLLWTRRVHQAVESLRRQGTHVALLEQRGQVKELSP